MCADCGPAQAKTSQSGGEIKKKSGEPEATIQMSAHLRDIKSNTEGVAKSKRMQCLASTHFLSMAGRAAYDAAHSAAAPTQTHNHAFGPPCQNMPGHLI